MKIQFSREGKQAVAKVTIAVPNYDERIFSFSFECGGEVYAGLLVDAMCKAINNEIEALRQDEYESGWRDKAAHKGARRSWFSSTLGWRSGR